MVNSDISVNFTKCYGFAGLSVRADFSGSGQIFQKSLPYIFLWQILIFLQNLRKLTECSGFPGLGVRADFYISGQIFQKKSARCISMANSYISINSTEFYQMLWISGARR